MLSSGIAIILGNRYSLNGNRCVYDSSQVKRITVVQSCVSFQSA